jgi:Skp family chaperone for outer membrane proteins
VTSRRLTIALVTLLFAASAAWSQKIGYVSTETIRKNFDAAVKAEQRLEGLIDGH